MGLKASIQTGTATATRPPGAGAVNIRATLLNEFSRCGAPWFGMDCEAQTAATAQLWRAFATLEAAQKQGCAAREGRVQRCLGLREFLAFKLGPEEYGIANAPAFVKGVVNLRGVIVPIVNTRDAVSDAITLTPEQLRPVPEFNFGIATDHLLAIGAVGDRMLILVDTEKLNYSEELGLAQQTLQ